MAGGYRRFGDDNMEYVGDIVAFPGTVNENYIDQVYIPSDPNGVNTFPNLDDPGYNNFSVKNPKIAIIDLKIVTDDVGTPVIITLDGNTTSVNSWEIFAIALPDTLDKPEYAGKFALSINKR